MPGIEREARTDVNGKSIPYFSVDLTGSAPLDLEKFDSLVAKVGYKEDPDNSYANLIVAQDRMFLFHGNISHANTFRGLIQDEDLNKHDIQCAARIKINHRIGIRVISGNVEAFDVSGLLSYERSDAYKKGLPKILGQGFQVA